MATNRQRRVAKEIADIHSDTSSKIQAEPFGNGADLTHLKGRFKGPPGTPYEGGTYVVDIRIPNEYPFRPPIMKFDTKLWHPNVSSQTVCGSPLYRKQFPSRPRGTDVLRVPSVSIHSHPPGRLC